MLLEKQIEAGVRPLKLRATMTAENRNRREIQSYFREFGAVRMSIGSSVGTAFAKSAVDISEMHQSTIDVTNEAYMEDWSLT